MLNILGKLGFGGKFRGKFGRAAAMPPDPPMAPPGMRIYVVGDIHGEAGLFRELCAQIRADGEEALARGLDCVLILLGDYVDRGPDSRTVLEMLANGPVGGMATRPLLGNHEAAMLAFLDDPVAGAPWLDHGGIETLASYGVTASAGTADAARLAGLRDAFDTALPEAHRRVLDDLEEMVILGDYAFVHAGIDPRRPLDRQERRDLLSIRGPFLRSAKWHGKLVIHGHTVVIEPEFLSNRIALDTGAYATGLLSGLILEGNSRRLIHSRPAGRKRSG